MALQDYEFQYGTLTFGKGHAIGVASIEGLDDLAIDTGDIRLPRSHGAISGLHTVRPREVTMTLYITGAKRSQALADSVEEAYAAFQVSDEDILLTWKEPGHSERYLRTRPLGRVRLRDASTTHGLEMLSVRMTAADPRIYASTATTGSLSLYSATGGGTDYGIDYGADFTVDASSIATVTNNGNADAYPVLTFFGPTSGTITGVQITNDTTGVILDIDQAILVNQTLAVDLRRVVAADTGDTPYLSLDGTNVYGSWQHPRTPLALAPGDNALRYEITGTATEATCGLSFRDTWL